tara:strand:- start:4417 stop:4896 length:480 start_codon:yes stop_codon:yes gene_type:complete
MSLTKGQKLGRMAKMYINTGTDEAEVLLEVDMIDDVEVSLEKATNEIDIRASGNTKTTVGNRKISLSTKYYELAGYTDAVKPELMASWNDDSPINMVVLNQDVSVVGAEGFRGPFVVTNFGKTENVNEQQTRTLELAEAIAFDDDGNLVDVVPYVVEAP